MYVEGPRPKILDLVLINLLPGRTACRTSARLPTSAWKRCRTTWQKAEIVRVEVAETDEKGRIKLSIEGAGRASCWW